MERKSYFYFESVLSAVGDCRLDNQTLLELWHGFCYHAGSLDLLKGNPLCFTMGAAELPTLSNDAEFSIVVTEDGIAARAHNYSSLARALMVLMMRIEAVSLVQGKERFRIQTCRLLGKYTIQNRMIHFCVFAETSPIFLRKCIRLAGIMQYTHVVLEFWGMLRYDCLKELSWAGAFTKDQARSFVKEIEQMGMEAIPMFNHLGHASACRVSCGKHVVLDQNPRLAPLFSEDGWAWNISSSETRNILTAVRSELYTVFRGSSYIHLGCDEVYSYENGDENQGRMRTYLRSLLEEVIAEGRRPIIWGDMLLNEKVCGVDRSYFCSCGTPENAHKIIACIPKETVIADWQYDVAHAPVRTSIYLKEHGFDVLGAPWFNTANGRAHADTIERNGLMGIMVTTWHTLAQQMPHIVIDALLCGAHHSPWSGVQDAQLRTETAALLRKLVFVDGDYSEAGWTERQVFSQARPTI